MVLQNFAYLSFVIGVSTGEQGKPAWKKIS